MKSRIEYIVQLSPQELAGFVRELAKTGTAQLYFDGGFSLVLILEEDQNETNNIPKPGVN